MLSIAILFCVGFFASSQGKVFAFFIKIIYIFIRELL